MDYITRKCPKCNGELHVPADLKNCICMYCGENFRPQQNVENLSEDTIHSLEAEYQNTLEKIGLLLAECDMMLPQFVYNKYSNCFVEYEERCAPLIASADRYASLSDNNRVMVVTTIAQKILELAENLISEKSKKKKMPKATLIDQYRFFFTVYLVPMIRHLKLDIKESLADAIVDAWIKAYPKYPFQKSTFDDISEGFRKKGLCFITTAVCETLNKEDDCYELTSFRSFRDSYMMAEDGRSSMVEEYYKIAPAIVTAINIRPDSSLIYRQIWSDYLQPCLNAIDNEKPELCEINYMNMVEELKQKYYFINM